MICLQFFSIYPKIDLSIPVGNEKLINNDAVNTNLDYYDFLQKLHKIFMILEILLLNIKMLKIK